MALLNKLRSIVPKRPPTCSVVIAAAGSSQRCKGEDKLLYIINDRPVLAHTIEVFQNCVFVEEIVVVTRNDLLEKVSEICNKNKFKKVTRVIAGGESRAESVFIGIFAITKKTGLIAVHDGARACIDADTIERAIAAGAKHHAAAPGIEVTSTLKLVEDDVVKSTVERNNLVEMQTPQVFKPEIIKAAMTKVINKSTQVTDESMAVELLGMPVHVVKGSRSNIKITNNEDLLIAEKLLTWQTNKEWSLA